MPDFEYEEKYIAQGYKYIAGVDEAGRGPLAGPVVAATVVLPLNFDTSGLNDSKKMTDKKRREVYKNIVANADYGVGMCSPKEIDELNIRNAAFLAMNRALGNLKQFPDFVLVDGNAIKYIELPYECIIKGDGKANSIAAASIIAKVTRDVLMEEYAKVYPEYGFELHKGYPTKFHYEKIKEHGILPIHRQSFRLGERE